jgi:hypothetical protein
MDASTMYPGGFHPRYHASHPTRMKELAPRTPRSRATVKYYFIGFGLSVQYPDKGSRGKVLGFYGLDKTTPELSNTIP